MPAKPKVTTSTKAKAIEPKAAKAKATKPNATKAKKAAKERATTSRASQPESVPQFFNAELFKIEELSWTVIAIGFDVPTVFGTKTGIRVKGTLDGYPYAGLSLMPAGEGEYFMSVKKELQQAIGKRVGDMVEVVMERDFGGITVPDDLLAAFKEEREAKNYFDSLSEGNKKFYIDWITSAKRLETRLDRIQRSIEKLKLKKRWWEK